MHLQNRGLQAPRQEPWLISVHGFALDINTKPSIYSVHRRVVCKAFSQHSVAFDKDTLSVISVCNTWQNGGQHAGTVT